MPDKTIGALGLAAPVSTMKIPVETASATNAYITVGAITATSALWFNVRTYGAVGNGVTNDATAIDAAVSAALTAGGGIVYFPAGTYAYSGAGIVWNPGAGVASSLLLRGDGQGATRLSFDAVSNNECIKLASQSTMGSGASVGGGVVGMSIYAVTTRDVIRVEAREGFTLQDLFINGGRTPITVSESRNGVISDVFCSQFVLYGINVIGESYSANTYQRIGLTGGTGATHGFRHIRTTTVDSGGLRLSGIGVSGCDAGFLFQGPAGKVDIYLFADNCAADWTFTSDAWLFKNVGQCYLQNSWGYVGTGSATACPMAFDGARLITLQGGAMFHSGASAADFNFKNACDNIALYGVEPNGLTVGYRTDATTHTRIHVDNKPSRATTISNDKSKFQTKSQARSSAYHTATQSLADGVWTALTFNTNVYDYGPVHSTSVNPTLFIAPTDGEYRISGQVSFAANITGTRGIRFQKNATSVHSHNLCNAVTGVGVPTQITTSVTLTLVAGDFVSVEVFQNSGGALDVLAASATDRATSAQFETVKAW